MTTLAVECPICGAPVGFPCNAAQEGQALAEPHAERTNQTVPWSESPYGAVELGYDEP